MGRFYNQQSQNDLRKYLRKEQTPAETWLWWHIQGKQLGYKFRRQYGVGPFVVDFYCPKLRLAIEVDGDTHFGSEAEAYDLRRERYLNEANIHVIRFTNDEVYNNIEDVLEVIQQQFPSANQTPLYPPL
jgi:very-short-patch-repair endonuclease